MAEKAASKQYKQRIADKAIRKVAVQDKSVGRAGVPRKANENNVAS